MTIPTLPQAPDGHRNQRGAEAASSMVRRDHQISQLASTREIEARGSGIVDGTDSANPGRRWFMTSWPGGSLCLVMCLKVSRLFGSTPEFWIRLQAEYDLKKAAQNKKVMRRVAQIVPLKVRA